jgi:hypothetical protein
MNLRTPAAAKMLGAASLVLIAGAGWLAVLGPKTSALADVYEQTDSAVSANEQLRQQLRTLKAQAGDLDGTRTTARALAAKFPATADQPGLFRQVTGAATRAGIPSRDVTALTPTPPVFEGADAEGAEQSTSEVSRTLARQTVTVSVESSYAATQRLLANLEEMPRAFLVSAVTITAGPTPRTYVATVTGDMFVMPPAVAPEDATTKVSSSK